MIVEIQSIYISGLTWPKMMSVDLVGRKNQPFQPVISRKSKSKLKKQQTEANKGFKVGVSNCTPRYPFGVFLFLMLLFCSFCFSSFFVVVGGFGFSPPLFFCTLFISNIIRLRCRSRLPLCTSSFAKNKIKY